MHDGTRRGLRALAILGGLWGLAVGIVNGMQAQGELVEMPGEPIGEPVCPDAPDDGSVGLCMQETAPSTWRSTGGSRTRQALAVVQVVAGLVYLGTAALAFGRPAPAGGARPPAWEPV